ncbi:MULTISPECIES: nicotinamide-nucleotide amidohydrolase family protein [unclassified Chelatococcus]|uniref:CinA family protein n=1 Tax=unclassified Chelatococcus TaxID=2638111 RepID=UPI001BCB88AE|nr:MULTISPECIES: nicotinamide-nucleotide amidohydrolase family protein [unclassified Chelatococcus]MBS7699351.1 CinA family protein [Chelatococcus sp. YT9]MBX3557517.1 CinA family protein [Chelatococcus sp.]
MADIEFTRIDRDLVLHAKGVLELCRGLGLRIVTAESCTGGLVAAVLTELPGSSETVEGGFVTYSNEAKHSAIGVPEALITQHGAVSETVARAMAEGALARTLADVSVAITGIAGPGGGSEAKPVGLVHFAAARRGFATLHAERRFGDLGRGVIRRRSVEQALDLLAEIARQPLIA